MLFQFLGSSSPQPHAIQMRETNQPQAQQLHSSEPTSIDSSSLGSMSTIGASLSSNSTTTVSIYQNGNGMNERTRDLALCAVILDEWLKELSAISQEHSIVMLTYSDTDNVF